MSILTEAGPAEDSFSTHEWPFIHHLGVDLLPAETITALARTWPEVESLTRRERSRRGGDKVYSMNFLAVSSGGRPKPGTEGLPEPWARLCEALDRPGFRRAVGRQVGLDLSGDATEIGIYAHKPGDGVTVHKDKPHKSLSCILYLNDDWSQEYGGEFCLYDEADLETPVRTLPPRPGQAIMFAPSERSWHSVAPVRSGAPVRRTIQVEFVPPA